jgi:hypothetical protein
MDRLGEFLRAVRHPVLVLGGGRWIETSRDAIHGFAWRFQMTVATSCQRLTLFDPLHPCYAGGSTQSSLHTGDRSRTPCLVGLKQSLVRYQGEAARNGDWRQRPPANLGPGRNNHRENGRTKVSHGTCLELKPQPRTLEPGERVLVDDRYCCT